MKKILSEYCYVIANVFMGIAFGFAFFYLFLNFFHYQELRREVRYDGKNDTMIISLNKKLDQVLENVNTFSLNHYRGTLDYTTAYNLNHQLKKCVNLIKSDTFNEITSKEYLNIKDVYFLRENFEDKVLNECMAAYIYPFIVDENNKDSYIRQNRDVLTNYINLIFSETSYLENELENTSNYYFTTDNYSLMVNNKIRDGYYETILGYLNAAEFLEDISEWYRSRVGGSY